MGTYRVEYPGAKPRMIEARTNRRARQHAAKAFTITPIKSREVADLTEKGIDLETAENGASESR